MHPLLIAECGCEISLPLQLICQKSTGGQQILPLSLRKADEMMQATIGRSRSPQFVVS